MAKSEVTLKVSPTELTIFKQALFAYELLLKLDPTSTTSRRIMQQIESRYGDNLIDLPMSLQIAVRKVRNGLY